MNKTTSYNNARQYNTNYGIKPVESGYSGSSVFGIVLLVVVILVVLSAMYWAYNLYTKKALDQSMTVDVMKDVKDASSKFAIGSGAVPSSKYSNEYSISMWLNIQDYTYNYGKEKVSKVHVFTKINCSCKSVALFKFSRPIMPYRAGGLWGKNHLSKSKLQSKGKQTKSLVITGPRRGMFK